MLFGDKEVVQQVWCVKTGVPPSGFVGLRCPSVGYHESLLSAELDEVVSPQVTFSGSMWSQHLSVVIPNTYFSVEIPPNKQDVVL